MTTYPLTIPTSPGFTDVQIDLLRVTALSQSPYSLSQQAYEHPGAMWEANVSLPPMSRAQAGAWQAFIVSLHGRRGTFLMGKAAETSIRGTASTVLANGSASARATSMTVDGMGSGGTLKAGDYFEIASHLYMTAADVTANGSGQATLTFEPGLRNDVADNTSLVLTNPQGTWRLTADNVGWTINAARNYGISFSCIEAL